MTVGEVMCEFCMFLAMALRIPFIGTISSAGSFSGAAPAGAALSDDLRYSRISPAITRPCDGTLLRSICALSASFFASGELFCAGGAVGADWGACSFAFAPASLSWGCSAGLMLPSFDDTAAFSPSATRTSVRTPVVSASMSLLPLSLITAKSRSPSRTNSPGFLNHFTSVPSLMPLYILGMTISAAISHPSKDYAWFSAQLRAL